MTGLQLQEDVRMKAEYLQRLAMEVCITDDSSEKRNIYKLV